MGTSPWSDETDAILIRQQLQPPSIVVPGDIISNGAVVRATNDPDVRLQVAGKPAPSLTWFKDGEEFKFRQGDRLQIRTGLDYSTLVVKGASRVDVGEFKLVAENGSGKAEKKFKLVVLDKPGAPKNVKISDVKANRLKLAWEEPDHDGGAPIQNYCIERREASRPTWAIVAGTVIPKEFVVQKLIEGHEYIFRISAENKYGVGDSILSNEVMAKNP